MKKYIIGFIIGAILFSGIGVLASQIFARDIKYQPNDPTFKKEDGSDIRDTQEAIDELYKYSKLKPTLLWSNSNSNSSFNEQTISLNLSDYRYILITSIARPSEDYYPRTVNLIPIIPSEEWSYSDWFGSLTATGTYSIRPIIPTSSQVYIGNEYPSSDNSYVIPLEIYGIKGDLNIDLGMN